MTTQIIVLVIALVYPNGQVMFPRPQQMKTMAACEAAAADWRNTPLDRALGGKLIRTIYADCEPMQVVPFANANRGVEVEVFTGVEGSQTSVDGASSQFPVSVAH